MANKEIRDYPDFAGESNEGYLIVGGKTSSISGGKILLSDIGGGRYNVIRLDPTETTSEETYTIIANNNTLYIVDLNNISDTLYHVRVIVPTISQDEYLNIVIQIKPYENETYDLDVIDSSYNSIPRIDYNYNISSYNETWVQVNILGDCCTVAVKVPNAT